jgi:hypothetical protein
MGPSAYSPKAEKCRITIAYQDCGNPDSEHIDCTCDNNQDQRIKICGVTLGAPLPRIHDHLHARLDSFKIVDQLCLSALEILHRGTLRLHAREPHRARDVEARRANDCEGTRHDQERPITDEESMTVRRTMSARSPWRRQSSRQWRKYVTLRADEPSQVDPHDGIGIRNDIHGWPFAIQDCPIKHRPNGSPRNLSKYHQRSAATVVL